MRIDNNDVHVSNGDWNMNDTESKDICKALTDMQHQLTQMTDMYKELSVIIARFEDRHMDHIANQEKLFSMVGMARKNLSNHEHVLKQLIENAQYKFIS